jgi:cytochrome c oxidase subunit II
MTNRLVPRVKFGNEMEFTVRRHAIAAGLFLFATTWLGGQTRNPQRFEIAARRFSFSPNEITVKKGVPVMIRITSHDVTHGLVLEAFGVWTQVKKGESRTLTLTPAETGTFEGRCAHFCGKGHRSMTLTLHVVE